LTTSRRKTSINGQFSIRLLEMQESPAYRALSLSGHRALSRIEIELRHHGGEDNGQLPVTFDDFEDYGISRHSIGPALAEIEALGFIVITQHGTTAKAAEYRRTNKFRLTTYPGLDGVGPEGCRWRRFKTLEEAFTTAEAARTNSRGKKNPPVQKMHRRSVQKMHRGGPKASAETAPPSGAETTPLSISREGEPQSPVRTGSPPAHNSHADRRRLWRQQRSEK